MSNMSYCRFQNTASDFEDCLEGLQEVVQGEDTLSSDEYRAAQEMFHMCKQYIEMFTLLTDAKERDDGQD